MVATVDFRPAVHGDDILDRGVENGSVPPECEELLRELGVIFTPKTLHDPKATPGGVKEFALSARWTWGHERVL